MIGQHNYPLSANMLAHSSFHSLYSLIGQMWLMIVSFSIHMSTVLALEISLCWGCISSLSWTSTRNNAISLYLETKWRVVSYCHEIKLPQGCAWIFYYWRLASYIIYWGTIILGFRLLTFQIVFQICKNKKGDIASWICNIFIAHTMSPSNFNKLSLLLFCCWKAIPTFWLLKVRCFLFY